MPIIQPSEKDLLMGKVVEPAWYRLRIDTIGEAPSGDGGSTNYPVDGTIVRNADNGSTDFAGVPIRWNFNSKFISPAFTFLECLGVTVEAGKRYDLASAQGMEIDVYVENVEWKGRILNRVNHKYRKPRD